MSPRQAVALRGRVEGESLRDHLIATAALMIEEHGTANLTVREIAHQAHVADGVLYNHFADKEDLVVNALQVYVERVIATADPLPEPGTGTVAHNLTIHISRGLAILMRIIPVFASLLSEPNVVARFHERVGIGAGERALPAVLATYLRAEQHLGRIDSDANVAAATSMLIGACHGVVLPRMLFGIPGAPLDVPESFVEGLVVTVLRGIEPCRSDGG